MKRDAIQMRDPFVLVHDGQYILTGTTDADCWRGQPTGFDAYTSTDLENFTLAGKIFAPSENFFGTQNFWAPEIHPYKGAYYLFASFKAPGRCRATAILRADTPLGPYLPHGAETVTPEDWECLDGTLFVDDAQQPWLVFCHEWVQIGDGAICARRLKPDLSGAESMPITLFSASKAPWAKKVRHSSGMEGHVTDGPFLYRPKGGGLWMLWSSLSESGYAIGLATSRSGDILGPWDQQPLPIYAGDGGHGMLFQDLQGILRLAIHTPNHTPEERPIFLPIQETGGSLRITSTGRDVL